MTSEAFKTLVTQIPINFLIKLRQKPPYNEGEQARVWTVSVEAVTERGKDHLKMVSPIQNWYYSQAVLCLV
jgi:hypothetical protein